MEIEVRSTDLAAAARALKAVGRVDLRRELVRSVRASAKPAQDAAKRAAGSELPRRGGLAARVARSRFSTSVRTGARTAGVTVKARNGYDIGAMNRGRLRHKVFGRNVWVNQSVRPGWFSDSIQEQAPAIRAEVGKALERIQKELRN